MVGRTVNSPSKELTNSKETSDLPNSSMDKLSIKESDNPESGGTSSGPSSTTSASDDEHTLSATSESSPTSAQNSSESESLPRSTPLKSLITVKVKDFSGIFGGPSDGHVFAVSVDTTFGEFFIMVANRFNLQLGDFDLVYQEKSAAHSLASFPEDKTFADIGILPCIDKVYWMGLDQPPSTRKRKNRSADFSSQAIGHDDSRDSDMALSAFMDIAGPKRDFVGLKNKNMTCYLNSFIQGLWFTPEFRNAIYNFIFQSGRFNKKSLCLPLQKLFLQQQFSIRDSIDTDELIKTFGWEDRETWNQHDIEELCSVFMENLTAEFRETPMEGLIQALYFGTLDDYVKCLSCGKVSQRTDEFLVIPLPIKPFGSPVACPTLEAALNSFVAYEVLDGNNMYNCGQCGVPCPAHKGFKFNKLPYILTIQLKRFEYDYIKDRRMKLNDRVAFPFILDMNPYVENPSPDRKEALKVDMLKPSSMKEGGVRNKHSRPSIPLMDPVYYDLLYETQDDVETREEGAAADVTGNDYVSKILQDFVQSKGPEIYQLFGVMVHRGGINSGHYYAYILDFERGTWFRCDDAVVRPASVSDIESAYGGSTDDDRELTSAYMLLYRRFDPKLNTLPYYLEEMPAHMQEMWKVIAAMDQQMHEEEELAKNTVKMVCYLKDPNSSRLVEKTVQIPKSMCMVDVGPFVFKEITGKSEAIPACHNARVVRFDRDLEIIENSFEGHEEEPILTALRKRPPMTKNEGFLLELKDDSEYFQAYHHDDLVFRTHIVDHLCEEVSSALEVHAHPASSVLDLKCNIMHRFGLDRKEEMHLVAHFSDRYCPIAGDTFPLSLYKCDKINNLYVTFGNEDDLGDILLDFVEQYTKAEVTQIFIQVPQSFTGLSNAKVCQDDGSLINSGQNGDVIESSRSLEVVVNTENVIEPASGTSNTLVPDVKVPLPQPARKYFIKFSNESATEEHDVLCFKLRIDGQTPLYALSKKISELIQVNENDFVIYKYEKSEATEMRRMTERISTIKPFDRLFIKLEHRLQDGEFRIPVFLLCVGCLEKPLDFLTEIVVTMGMSLEEVRSAVSEKCEILQSIDKNRLRIRKKLRSNPSKIMRDNAKIQDLFSVSSIHVGELFVQALDEPCSLSDKTYSILYRHWHPSSGILDVPVEIRVFHDYTNDLEELILNKLKESLGCDDQVELEVAKPDGGYPWDISPRVIQDLSWFSLVPPAKKSLYVYSDELALFVRDKNEVPMDFQDMEAYRVHNVLKVPSSTSSTEQPRRETGLKINLSKSPTKS